MERVLAPENLRKAWYQVKANHGAPGIDGMTIEDFPTFAREHWASIREALRDEPYQPVSCAAYGDSETTRTGETVIRNSHGRGSDYPASHCASAGTDL
jgi:hypothetical protein